MKRIKLVIFDLDGTLVDSLPDLADAINHMRSVFGLPQLAVAEVCRLVGQGARNLVERALPGYDPDQVERGLNLFLDFNRAHIVDKTTVYPGVRETLSAIRADGRALAVISNKDVAFCREILARFGLGGIFTEVMGADSLPFRKPSPEPLLKLMRDFAACGGETMMVGDSINDIAAGKGAGVITVGCTYGYGDSAELAGADFLLADFPGLLGLPVLRY